MKTEKFDVTGMTCSSCVAHVEKVVQKLDGVQSVNVNLLTNSMTVTFNELSLDLANIEDSVGKAGYTAKVHTYDSSASDSENRTDAVLQEQRNMKYRWMISLGFLIPLYYVSMAHMIGLPFPHALMTYEYAFFYAFIQFWLSMPIIYINRKYFTNGFRALLKAAPNMDSLIAIGSSAAIAYGIYELYRIQKGLMINDLYTVTRFVNDLYFESAATILTLITLGKYLEAKSKNRTSEAIKRLLDLAPKFATVIRSKVEFEIPVEEVMLDEIVVVRPGQQIPVDGIVYTGNSSIDESALTGESMPVFKQKGDAVFAASINKSGYFTIKATKVGKDTTLAQIIQLVEDASSSKAPISKLADKISAVFVPFVIVIAALSTCIWWLYMGHNFEFSISIGIAVLVISCPCALGLATPVAIMVGTGKGADYGILIKSAESLQLAQKVDTIVLDKTGTLTEGKPRVTDIFPGETITEVELLKLAASLEKPSEHPLAEAIMHEVENRNIEIQTVQHFKAIPGLGIEASIDKQVYIAGNQRLMTERGIQLLDFDKLADKLATEGKTPLFVANSSQVLGIIAVADVLKPTSVEAVKLFLSMGLNVVMLTGDHAKTAAAIQAKLGISKVIAQLLPQDKDQEITKLQAQGKIVAMIGDGINDAPALMRSDLGIAIGAGTDVAIESADIVLMRSDLLDAVTTLRLSKAVMANIKQNLFWAFFYNVVGIPLAAGVFYTSLGWKLNPMFAAAAMSLSSVTVVLNALRLLRFKPNKYASEEIKITQNKEIKSINPTIQTTKYKYIMSEKTLIIKGMSCGHCSARVEKALNAIEGVEAKVDLESNSAALKLTQDVSDETLKTAIDNVGYEVVEVK
jgi:P-type Cu+ transporter